MTENSYQAHILTRHSEDDASGSIASSHSHSSGSFCASKEWFKRLASYTSPSPFSMGSDSNNIELTNDLVGLISRCLKKSGEESEYLPLFKVIFATLGEVEENRYTRLLDGRARDILLTGVITRMVYHASVHVGLVFSCDDIQCKHHHVFLIIRILTHLKGGDSSSIRMLEHIHDHCPKVMLMLATRPMKDYNVTFTEDFKKNGSYLDIQLKGLGEAEIGEIILQNFDRGVDRISPEIVKVVQVLYFIILQKSCIH